MGYANYVNKVGKLINDSTKYNAKLDRVAIKNIVLIDWLENLISVTRMILNDPTLNNKYQFTEENLNKLVSLQYCLIKELNFYESKVIDDDCILTETESNIIQE